jgi:hypothetical protein
MIAPKRWIARRDSGTIALSFTRACMKSYSKTIRAVDLVKRNPDGSLDFNDMKGPPIALAAAIGQRAWEMSKHAKITPEIALVADVMTASMMVGVVYLCRGKRYDLLRLLESDPLTFWDEMTTIARHIITKPLAHFPENVKLRFAQTSALH